MYLTMKAGNTIIAQQFISLRHVYEEGYVQDAIRQLIEANEEKVAQYEEQLVFTLEELTVKPKTTARKSALASLKVLWNLFGKSM